MTRGDAGWAPAGNPPVPGLREAIRGDLAQMAKIKGCRFPSIGGYLDILSIPGTWAVILFRLASTAHHRGLRPISRFIFFVNCVLFGAEMHPGAIFQPGLVIPHPIGICFSSGIRAGKRVLMLRNSGMGSAGDPKRPGNPVLGDDVALMDSARILGPTHIGDRSIIGASALVVDDVPPDTFVFGASKSTRMRPLAEMGLGVRAEVELGYGIHGRRASATADTADTEVAVRANGRQPTAT